MTKIWKRVRLNKILLVLEVLILVIFGGFLFKRNIQKSTLQWVLIPGVDRPLDLFCNGQQLYPPNSWDWPFPAFSPDRRFYVNVSNGNKTKSKWIKMFKANTKKEIGRYYSEYSSLIVLCWAKDNSGIYLLDYDPGFRAMIDIGLPSKYGEVKKLLVPSST
ncbi:hypothetical protein A3D05_05430 [Candidatus Gottesmanbacteria bacterium RIFCSPHIGHO2_02_FULL_40_24]|uniref:Uncharacterized protein n=1 Tax=Candidatus Gottesmanbacteria bacterium RIFCSPHIGHO2_01_FULL_40_15 TaxID=1798376 RepID=A0A1F5Z6U6_9BACT|nr:MAG: hypothetical protein A2777_02065 [Candidatus Gottesmanbacteria bacterium RIFCSPHIGHO2_01_FULL_40_15]OGG16472.1 MAG: hypothetical protein A3D05_05430 [Candidatus Gottesmanbacteria bacterium RIFCSPHIGHO2_02_FULL_40_24]OGG22752.1 MAG: hypothetical protein A3B48_03060 [Candidatus Gottesmanbacteria bacterium RIFCSPLOWO2_01_FULL_40_10]OGG25585.1 MAG: hypothetical protein A3E42_04580 [Candidatus Gottesmanbacteria bacterium RIFCSPHIGHO2_12_FULL_40_13]OGG32590.1 MAG: hypothetical protein A3I80_0